MGGFEWTRKTIIVVALSLLLPLGAGAVVALGTAQSEAPETIAAPAAVDVEPYTPPSPSPDVARPSPIPHEHGAVSRPPLPQPEPAPGQPASAGPAPAPPPGPVQSASILDVENRLVELSYLVGSVDGVMDGALKHGLTAFQKVEGLERTGELDAATLSRLETATRPTPRFNTPPTHFEIDIDRQVVFVVENGGVLATLPTSTGNNKLFTSQGWTRRAVTPNGTYEINFKRNGWRYAPLGALYRPAYFNGGIAFHGSKSVPTYPASHGCVRLPMQFADWFADRAHIGTTVYVYGGPSGENPQPQLDGV